jgi:hypothetical protein
MKLAIALVLLMSLFASVCIVLSAPRATSTESTSGAQGKAPSHCDMAIFAPHSNLTGQAGFGDYVVRTYRSADDGEGSFEVLREGRRVLAGNGFCFDIGRYRYDEDSFPRGKVGKDINGDGIPDGVIWEWTAGAHESIIARAIELQGDCRILATIDGQDSVPHLEDLEGEGKLAVVLYDWTHAYWPGCFAKSPAPKVILRWQNGNYVLASDLMKKELPSEAERQERARLAVHQGGMASRLRLR